MELKHVGETFAKQRIVIDDAHYDGCTFIDCEIVYRGGDLNVKAIKFMGTCKFTLEGSAGATLMFLKSLYHGMGPLGLRMVEDIFNEIRRPAMQGMPTPPAPNTPFN